MHICIVVPYVTNTLAGGVATQIKQTILHLEKDGHTVTIFNPAENTNWKQFDIVHIFKASLETYSLASMLHSRNIPFVLSPIFFSNYSPLLIKTTLMTTAIARTIICSIRADFDFISESCKFSSNILPNTKSEAELIKKGFGIDSKKIIVIPNGVESRFANATPDLFKEKFNAEGFILSVTNLGLPRKNCYTMIQALMKIDHPAIIVGPTANNSYAQKCHALIKKTKHIKWIGPIPHSDNLFASTYAAANCFVLPSLFETPGIAAMEAALAKCKIVITPHGGTKEYFKNFVDYAEPRSINSIANAIKLSLKKNADISFKNHLLEKYSWESVATQTVAAYVKTIQKT